MAHNINAKFEEIVHSDFDKVNLDSNTPWNKWNGKSNSLQDRYGRVVKRKLGKLTYEID